jgi:hypothetical protein
MSDLQSSAVKNPRPKNAITPQTEGGVMGAPKIILRLEALAVLVGASAAYAQFGNGWLFFAILFLVPDISMLGYLIGKKTGAATYNIGHSYILPALIGAFGVAFSQPIAVAIALIWIAHIGFDRLLGYGLKYDTAFAHTHLGQAMGMKAVSTHPA